MKNLLEFLRFDGQHILTFSDWICAYICTPNKMITELCISCLEHYAATLCWAFSDKNNSLFCELMNTEEVCIILLNLHLYWLWSGLTIRANVKVR